MISTTINFNATAGVLSGTLAYTAPPPTVPWTPPSAPLTVVDLVVSAYADATGNASAYFGQCRSSGSGNWSVSTNSLPIGTHTISVTLDYGPILASTTITTTTGGVSDGSGSRRDLLVNNNARA